MIAAWSATLPEFVLRGAQETLTAQVIESSIAAGESKVRQRIRGQWRPFSLQIRCSQAQLAKFETFYTTTLASGVLPFTWVHPRTRAAARFRFIGPAPQLSPLGTNADGVFATLSFKLVRIA